MGIGTNHLCRHALAAVLVLLSGWQTAAQLQTRPHADTGSGAPVVLEVVARTANGAAWQDLRSDQFELLDNGRRIPAEELQVERTPAQLLLVLDALNTPLALRVRAQQAVLAYLRRNGGHLAAPTSLLFVGERTGGSEATAAPEQTMTLGAGSSSTARLSVHRVPASQDGLALARALEQDRLYLAGPDESIRPLAVDEGQRVQQSLQALGFLAQAETAIPGPKIMVWVGSGWPLLSRSAARSSNQVFDSVIYFSDLLRRARIVLYAASPEGVTSKDQSGANEAYLLSTRPEPGQSVRPMAPPTTPGEDYYRSLLEAPAKPVQANPNQLALQVLAVQSGGVVFEHSNDLSGALVRLADDAGAVNTVTYRMSPDRDESPATTLHRLKLRRLAEGPAVLRTRTSFYSRR